MKDEIEKAITLLAKKITTEVKSGDDALKFTQAVVNLAHAREVISITE